MAIEVLVDKKLGDRKNRQEAKKLDQALIELEIVDDSCTILEKNILVFLLRYFLQLINRLGHVVVAYHIIVHVHNICVLMGFVITIMIPSLVNVLKTISKA